MLQGFSWDFTSWIRLGTGRATWRVLNCHVHSVPNWDVAFVPATSSSKAKLLVQSSCSLTLWSCCIPIGLPSPLFMSLYMQLSTFFILPNATGGSASDWACLLTSSRRPPPWRTGRKRGRGGASAPQEGVKGKGRTSGREEGITVKQRGQLWSGASSWFPSNLCVYLVTN